MPHRHQTDTVRQLETGTFQALCACGHRGAPRDTIIGARRELGHAGSADLKGKAHPSGARVVTEFLARTRLTQAAAIDEEPF
jgi:hypothetical protein